ncbi:MAG: hypothetical protein SNJ82_06745 [Gemmataceae bacterium]
MRRFFLCVALVGLLVLARPTSVVAHPCLEGTWSSPLPCPGVAAYTFGPARFVGNGVWEGCLHFTINGRVIATGEYQLRMWTNTDGTVSIREGEGIGTAAGIVDFKTNTIDYLNTMYRK